ncbi:alpha/beta hydrolase [Bradyrhizobium sp. SSUT18]|uniref:alpha/beta fold hydrolase n=1 Tax=Bradyrhizobium sp. SSUT18 TaxID=3040602 RepID=UPI0024471BF4|nr:alpha/beta hydrolase [Bradyrhizobium sp. SSUT18]
MPLNVRPAKVSTIPDIKDEYRVESVVSADGTTIGYRRYGRGPGIVLVEGAMGTAHNYDQLARSLAGNFTVIVPDRRGRGLSPRDFSPDHCLQKEIEDLESLFGQTEAEFLFGLSSGGVIALAAARYLPALRKVILYEPPFPVGSDRFHLVPRFNREVTEGKMATALVTANQMVGLAPPILAILPRSILQLLTGAMLRRDDKTHGEYTPIRTLLPAMRYDFNVVSEMQGKAGDWGEAKVEILLLGGTKSPAYLKMALGVLEQRLPAAKRIEFEGLAHSGPWNADRRGSPNIVADAISEFILKPNARSFAGRAGPIDGRS